MGCPQQNVGSGELPGGLREGKAVAAPCQTQPIPAVSSQLQQTQHRTQLSPSAKLVTLLGKHILESTIHWTGRGEVRRRGRWGGESEKQHCEYPGQRRRRRSRMGFRCQSRDSPAGHGQDRSGAVTSLQPMERTTPEQISTLQPVEDPKQSRFFPVRLQPVNRTHAGVGEKCEEERLVERNHYGLIATHSPSPCTAWSVGTVVTVEEAEELGMRD